VVRNTENIIEEILQTIQGGLSKFEKAVPGLERSILNEIELIAKDLSLQGGNVKASVENLKKIQKLNSRIEKAIQSPEYQNSVKEFASTFEKVAALQTEYFSKSFMDFKASKFLAEIKTQSIDSTVSLLTETGINTNITDKVKDLMRQNITGRSSYYDLTKQVREFIIGNDKIPGKLKSYSSQITIDSINTFAADYNKSVTEDLGLEWSKYTGALVEGSREFCIKLLKKKYIHKSELGKIASGNIDGVTVSRAGLKPGTTGENLQQLRGGYRCNHLMLPVAKEAVPKELRNTHK
jgi:hypothetical protein